MVGAVYAAGGLALWLAPRSTAPSHVEQAPTEIIDVIEPLSPEPPPEPRADRARDEEGAAGKKADPTEIVAPKPTVALPAKPTIPAAPVAGTGASSNAGEATAGSGAGAGGSGSGRGGGGRGDFSGYTPARLIQNVRRGDYRALTAGRMDNGMAMIGIRIEPDGRITSCHIVRSSGDGIIDSGLCPFLTRRLRFEPARDDVGRPIPYRTNYVATWEL